MCTINKELYQSYLTCVIDISSYLTFYTDMIPNGLVTENLQQSADEPSLYLCLKIGQPINKSVSANCPIESYSKKKRPEYWFSIPREK